MGAEQLLCHRLSRFIKTPGAFFWELLLPLFPLPINSGGSGEAGGAALPCLVLQPHLGTSPALGKAVLGEYQPSSTFCSVNNGCYKPESCRARLKPAAAGGEALVCSRLGSAWDGKSQRELAGK